MKAYSEMTRQELLEEHRRLEEQYKKYRYAALSLDMSRGKPSPAQLDLSMGMMDVLNSEVDMTC